MAEQLPDEQRVRIHERIQEAVGLINQAEDDLPHDHPRKQELKALGGEVWEIGYDILGAARYSQVDELAEVIEQLDDEEPFLGAGPDDEDLFLRSPRRVAERILDRLHARARGEPRPVAPTSVGGTDG